VWLDSAGVSQAASFASCPEATPKWQTACASLFAPRTVQPGPAACAEGVAGVARLRKGSPWRDCRHLKFYELPDNLSQPGWGDTLSVVRRARTGPSASGPVRPSLNL